MDDEEYSLGSKFAQIRRATHDQQKHGKSKISANQHQQHSSKKRYRDESDNDSSSSEDDLVRNKSSISNVRSNKVENKHLSDDSDNDNNEEHDSEQENSAEEEYTTTKTKHTPLEIPSNKPVSRFRQVVIVPRKERKDPRFEETAGTFKEHQFTKNYDFLDDYRDDEIKALQQEIKKVKNIEERTAMKDILTKLLQQRADVTNRRAVQEVLYNQHKSRQEAMENGSKPYYPKQREIRELAAVERFKQLESKGGAALDKAIQKKRKKLASKDRKRLPISALPSTRRNQNTHTTLSTD